MTLTELKAISGSCRTDGKFLANAEVRRVWWRALGDVGPWKHDGFTPALNVQMQLATKGCWPRQFSCECAKCHKWLEVNLDADHDIPLEVPMGKFLPRYFENDSCTAPGLIPGSLADAVEQMRAKVVEKWNDDAEMRNTFFAGSAGLGDDYILHTPRERFMVFAAALHAVEVGE